MAFLNLRQPEIAYSTQRIFFFFQIEILEPAFCLSGDFIKTFYQKHLTFLILNKISVVLTVGVHETTFSHTLHQLLIVHLVRID